jgi:hypothetical protein
MYIVLEQLWLKVNTTRKRRVHSNPFSDLPIAEFQIIARSSRIYPEATLGLELLTPARSYRLTTLQS